jgi:hypothetical protein
MVILLVFPFVDSTGYINHEGITFLTNEFYFLNQIRSAIIRCNDFKTLFMLFSHKTSFRNSISFHSQTSMRTMNSCSRIINHTHIGLNNFLTPEGIELVFGTQQHESVWIHIQNYSDVFTDYHAYCSSQTPQPSVKQPNPWFSERRPNVLTASDCAFYNSAPAKQPGFGFGYTFGPTNVNLPPLIPPIVCSITIPYFDN